MSTYGDLVTELRDWLKEPSRDSVLFNAINDAVSDLWEAEIRVTIQNFMGGPVNLSLAQGTERAPIVLIADPTAFPGVAQTSGHGPGDRTLSFRYTYVTDSGAETLPSPASTNQTFSAASLATVTSPAAVDHARGWNLYALKFGTPNVLWVLQNQDPLPFQDVVNEGYVWTEPGTGIAMPPGKSLPTENTTGNSIAYIDQLQLQLPDQTWKSYNQTELDTLLMRQLMSSVASASPYQTYAFDFVNNSRIEIRPATGAAINPRFFFISRPPKTKSPKTPIPFPSAGEEAFVRYRAISLVELSNQEFTSAAGWEARAMEKKQSILLALNQQNRKRDNTIRPYQC